VTETLWDVGIDTLEGHRRRGHAAACFHALAAWMAGRGRQPVWSAYEDYPPSLTLAAKLGFQPVDRIAVLSPTSQATS
jgi:predicted GNAT family acetyltransferase